MCNILHCLVNKTIKSWVLFRCWLNNLLAEWATVNRARFGVKWPSVKFLSSRRQLITWAPVDYDVISRSLMTSLSPIAPCSSSLHLEQSSLLEYQLLWDGGLIWYSREIGLCTPCGFSSNIISSIEEVSTAIKTQWAMSFEWLQVVESFISKYTITQLKDNMDLASFNLASSGEKV